MVWAILITRRITIEIWIQTAIFFTFSNEISIIWNKKDIDISIGKVRTIACFYLEYLWCFSTAIFCYQFFFNVFRPYTNTAVALGFSSGESVIFRPLTFSLLLFTSSSCPALALAPSTHPLSPSLPSASLLPPPALILTCFAVHRLLCAAIRQNRL